ncbi:MAG: TetR/AcrR family transcriptional regulator [bacterium]|nr:TetR/AcrR family transcriptional regulator [bacterium]
MKKMTDRQMEIIKKAVEIIDEDGLENLTIKRLAQEMKFSEAALYRHFKCKMSLLNFILDIFYNDVKVLHKKLDDSNLSPFNKVITFIKEHINLISSNKIYSTVVFSEELFRRKAYLTTIIDDIIDKNKDFISGNIKECQKTGEIRKDISSEHFAIIILGSIRLLIKKWYYSRYSFDLNIESGKIIKSFEKLLISKKK